MSELRTSTIARASLVALIALLVLGVLLDPYTFHETASDSRHSPPLWQSIGSAADILLLVIAAVSIWRRRYTAAMLILCVEASTNILVVELEIARDGLARFVMGFGARQYLTAYLCILGLRFLILALTVVVARPQGDASP